MKMGTPPNRLDKVSLAAMATAKPAIPAEAKTALTGIAGMIGSILKENKIDGEKKRRL